MVDPDPPDSPRPDGVPETSWSDLDEAVRGFGMSMLLRLQEVAGSMSTVGLPGEREAAAAATPTGAPSSRYDVVAELGRGGMGVVFRCRDNDLGRDVALKVLLENVARNRGMAQRFLEEARIGGQLQHPGIAPVHELGIGDDDRPYFTMKLIQGRDLGELLSERIGPSEAHRFLSIFESVCQTMAYAHSRGVIHRDLKPQNVMVGAFGEVLVVDWGLAKVLDTSDQRTAPEIDDLVEVVSPAGGDGSHSVLGSVKGTPSYMSPEQANGLVAEVDQRTDVFGLGAILCELLTGAPPYLGTREETLAAAQNADLADALARLAACGADPDLIQLVHACLAPALDERPVDAGVVAGIVKEYLSAAETRALEARVREQEERRARVQVEEARAREAAERERAELALADFERLADGKRLDRLLEEAGELWPATPDQVAPLEAWMVQAERLLANRERHEATLTALRERALEYDEAQQTRDRETHPEAEELICSSMLLEEAREQLAVLEAGGELPTPWHMKEPPTLEYLRGRLADLEAEVPQLEARVAARRTWRFENSSDQFMHDVLVELAERLRAFAEDRALSGSVVEVRERLAFARTVRERTVTGPRAHEAWQQAAAAVASHPAYAGLELRPQLGLLPIGADPDSGLWEFCHLQTGEVPERDAGGRIVPSEEMGIVLVLIPGGTFLMGAQSQDESGANHDPWAMPKEAPVHEVTLGPFLLGKYQVTQSQWLRFTGSNPSIYYPDPRGRGHARNLLHPVEGVSWVDCVRFVGQLGLCLPTESQWEYACRAGTTTPWWTGADMHALEGAANIGDRSFVRAGGNPATIAEWPELDTGFVTHSPVGTFRANPWGLHDVHGNVWEWCADWSGGHDRPVEDDTGRRPPSGSRFRIFRGGAFGTEARLTRSSTRTGLLPEDHLDASGLRAARRLE